MPTRRSKKPRSTKAPRKRKKIAPKKKGRSPKKKVVKKKAVKRSAVKKTVKKIVKKKSVVKKAVRVAPPPAAWPPRAEPSPTLKRGKVSKPPAGFKRVVLSYEEERAGFSDIAESRRQKIVDFVHAKEWRETGLPTTDELYDYLKWGADHFDVEISMMYQWYLGYKLEDIT